MPGRRTGPSCDKDCFHCKHPDCIYDRLDAEDYLEQDKMDRDIYMTPEKKKFAAQKRAYYEAKIRKSLVVEIEGG